MSNIYVVFTSKKWICCKHDILFTRCWWLLIEKWHNWNRTPKISFWCNQLGTTLSSLACPIHTILHTHPRNLPTSTSSRHNSRGSSPSICSQQLSSVNLPHSYISKIFCTPMQHTCRKLDAKALLFLLNSNYQMAKQFQSVTAFDFDVKNKSKPVPRLCFCMDLALKPPPWEHNRLHVFLSIHVYRSGVN